MAMFSTGKPAICPKCGCHMFGAGVNLNGHRIYQCTWTYCEFYRKALTEANLAFFIPHTLAQIQGYRAARISQYLNTSTATVNFTSKQYGFAQAYGYTHVSPIPPRTTMTKQVRITYLYNDTIVELHFITQPRRGWFKENIQPIIDILKSAIPATAREYDPATFKWQIAIEYWPALKQILAASQFDIKKILPSANAQGVNVPKDYAENFYHKPVAPKAETKESILTQLASLLGIHEDIASMELVALKKKYREAARKYHPDFGGDAAKMSELNRVWTIYNSGGSN